MGAFIIFRRSVAQSHTDSGRVSRADTELGSRKAYHNFTLITHIHCSSETGGKLSGRDKAVLGWLWTLSSVYGIMNEQLLTKVTRFNSQNKSNFVELKKVVDKPCDVREPVSGTLGILSLVFGLLIPLLLGKTQNSFEIQIYLAEVSAEV